MNFVSKLIKILHWVCFVQCILVLLTYGLFAVIFTDEPNLLFRALTFDYSPIFEGIPLNSTKKVTYSSIYWSLIISCIRFIIFKRFAWFPWTPLRK